MGLHTVLKAAFVMALIYTLAPSEAGWKQRGSIPATGSQRSTSSRMQDLVKVEERQAQGRRDGGLQGRWRRLQASRMRQLRASVPHAAAEQQAGESMPNSQEANRRLGYGEYGYGDYGSGYTPTGPSPTTASPTPLPPTTTTPTFQGTVEENDDRSCRCMSGGSELIGACHDPEYCLTANCAYGEWVCDSGGSEASGSGSGSGGGGAGSSSGSGGDGVQCPFSMDSSDSPCFSTACEMDVESAGCV